MITQGQVKESSLRDKLSLNKFKEFGSATPEDYSEKLRKLNFVDLYAHAISIGVPPNLDRKRMEKTLAESYKKAKSRCSSDKHETSDTISPDKKKSVLDKLAFLK